MKDEQSPSKCGKMNNNKQGEGEGEVFDNLIATLTKRLFQMVLKHNRTTPYFFKFFCLLLQVLTSIMVCYFFVLCCDQIILKH